MDGWEDWPDDFDDSEIQENELNSFNPVRYSSFIFENYLKHEGVE